MTALPNMDAVDFRFILLDQYKKLGISENELAVLMMLDHLLRQGNNMITADMLALKMNLKTKELDGLLVSLLQKNFIAYDNSGGQMRTSIEPLKKVLYKRFQLTLTKDRQNLLSAERAGILNRLYAYFEKRLNRTLSPLETDLINTWLDDGYDEDAIKSALEKAIADGRRNLKSVDKRLRAARRRDDIEKEGYSAVNDTYSADIEHTLEIAKVRWADGEN